jgi:hypothetical protein
MLIMVLVDRVSVIGRSAATWSMGISVLSRTTQECPALAASRAALRSLGARAASSATVSSTYRQAVAVHCLQRGRGSWV